MSELVERLRSRARWDTMTTELEPKDHIDWQAADTIEQLQARVDELESTLKDTCDHSMKMAKEIGELSGWKQACKNESRDRTALQKKAVDYGTALAESESECEALKSENTKLTAALERLGEKRYMFEANEVRARHFGPDWKAEIDYRIEYANKTLAEHEEKER